MWSSSLRAGTIMLTRANPGWSGLRSHSGRETSAIVGTPRAASTILENHASPRTQPAIQTNKFIFGLAHSAQFFATSSLNDVHSPPLGTPPPLGEQISSHKTVLQKTRPSLRRWK